MVQCPVSSPCSYIIKCYKLMLSSNWDRQHEDTILNTVKVLVHTWTTRWSHCNGWNSKSNPCSRISISVQKKKKKKEWRCFSAQTSAVLAVKGGENERGLPGTSVQTNMALVGGYWRSWELAHWYWDQQPPLCPLTLSVQNILTCP